jgi:hypothetical protein
MLEQEFLEELIGMLKDIILCIEVDELVDLGQGKW